MQTVFDKKSAGGDAVLSFVEEYSTARLHKTTPACSSMAHSLDNFAQPFNPSTAFNNFIGTVVILHSWSYCADSHIHTC